jgi:hypothetical protein
MPGGRPKKRQRSGNGQFCSTKESRDDSVPESSGETCESANARFDTNSEQCTEEKFQIERIYVNCIPEPISIEQLTMLILAYDLQL